MTWAGSTRPPEPCSDPDHSPPMHMVYEPGAWYEHVCPSCRRTLFFSGPPVFT